LQPPDLVQYSGASLYSLIGVDGTPPSLWLNFGYNHATTLVVEGTMPKQKTHKGIKKRFRVSATGKALHRHSGTSHLAYRLTKKRRRNLRGTTVVAKAETSKIVNALLPSQ
jgi:large subunit ribosomal protein L35